MVSIDRFDYSAILRLLFAYYGIEEGVRSLRVENLVAVHDRDKILSLREVDDVVRISGQHDDALNLVARDFELDNLIRTLFPLLDQAVAGNNDELLPFGVVPVLTFGDTRFADIDAYLSAVERVDQLGEGAAVVAVHLQVKNGLVLWKVAQIGAVEPLGKTVGRNLGDHQRLRHIVKLVQKVDDFAQRSLVSDGAVAVTSFGRGQYGQPFELAVVLLTFQRGNHLFNKVVDVKDLELHFRIVDRDGQLVGDVVAERGDGAVVVGTAPFSVEIGEAVNKNLYTVSLAILEEEIFARLLAAPVFAVAETAGKRGLGRAREHDGGFVPMLLQRVQKR